MVSKSKILADWLSEMPTRGREKKEEWEEGNLIKRVEETIHKDCEGMKKY